MALTLGERCGRIELLVLDVNGVLTDGRIIYDDDGVEIKEFHVRDGSALKLWQLEGKRAAVLSGRRSRAVEVRAAELGVAPVVQGASDKLAAYPRQNRIARALKEFILRMELASFPIYIARKGEGRGIGGR